MSSRHRLGTGGDGALTYEGYLKVRELIDLQKVESDPPHHDELLFIITHQAYELWFKQILFELDATVVALDADDAGRAIHSLRRVATIERLLVQQIHVLETMTPADFLGFRDRLNPASGFQSVQFREMEFLSGLKNAALLEEFAGDPPAVAQLRRRLDGRSLREAWQELLDRRGFEQPRGGGEAEDDKEAREARLLSLRTIYEDPAGHRELYDLCECLVEHDQQVQLWRAHHVAMVERMIGHKIGTGGSEGVGYLRSTLGKRFYPDLWAVRTRLRGPEEGSG